MLEADRERGFETEDSERRELELEALLVGGVRRVVAGDGVHRAVDQRRQQGFAVTLGSQGWIHLELGIESAFDNRPIGEQKVVRGRLAGHLESATLRLPHQADGAGGRHVRQVVPAAGLFDQKQIARHHDVLRQSGNPRHARTRRPLPFVHHAVARQVQILGVLDHRDGEMLRILESPPHQFGVRYRSAVVRNGDGASGNHRSHRRKLLAFEPFADRPDRENSRQRRALGGTHDDAGDPAVVVGRQGIGHAGDGSETAGDGGGHAGGDGLLGLLTRFPKVDMDVDEPRTDHLAAQVDDLEVVTRRYCRRGQGPGCGNPGHDAVGEQEIEIAVDALRGVDQAAAGEEDPLHAAGLRAEASR